MGILWSTRFMWRVINIEGKVWGVCLVIRREPWTQLMSREPESWAQSPHLLAHTAYHIVDIQMNTFEFPTGFWIPWRKDSERTISVSPRPGSVPGKEETLSTWQRGRRSRKGERSLKGGKGEQMTLWFHSNSSILQMQGAPCLHFRASHSCSHMLTASYIPLSQVRSAQLPSVTSDSSYWLFLDFLTSKNQKDNPKRNCLFYFFFLWC